MNNTKTKSTDLFSTPSFLKGTSRVFDLYGGLDEYNYRDDADQHALKKDWEIVGSDIRSSIKEYETNLKPQSTIRYQKN